MALKAQLHREKLRKRLRQGMRGFPAATEEGIDYPDGEACPQCPYWAGRDRFSG